MASLYLNFKCIQNGLNAQTNAKCTFNGIGYVLQSFQPTFECILSSKLINFVLQEEWRIILQRKFSTTKGCLEQSLRISSWPWISQGWEVCNRPALHYWCCQNSARTCNGSQDDSPGEKGLVGVFWLIRVVILTMMMMIKNRIPFFRGSRVERNASWKKWTAEVSISIGINFNECQSILSHCNKYDTFKCSRAINACFLAACL